MQASTGAARTAESRGEETRMIAEMIPESFSHVVLVTGSRSWNDEQSMRSVFNDAWRDWGAGNVIRPVLISGHCPEGADAVAERLWRAAGFEIRTFPAAWSAHGKRAGFHCAGRWSTPPWSSVRPGLRCCARPSSTSAGNPEARGETRSSSCRIRRGTSRMARDPLQGSRASRGDRDGRRLPPSPLPF
ncbi:SLOG family protein [Streptomyces xanthochromogenes]|uniref:SLOG family protein n=1 Tax=Streptomyces xanthochromogenes TaxID=67384 RepID=UPI003792977D